ncbi:adhesion G-protein coupled receptor F1-like [Limanda limanda]|uniref:adhesion G-protein coupled receptor F1-like n=1 Tax=Limanda limanda TaxID=27771 RepID=UPI0029C64CD1|nr:adhesion G-protein coupled receptor F1-like [Limanda limanda]
MSGYAVLTGQWKYSIDVVVNVSDAQTFELIRSSLNATDLPAQIDNQTEISDISTTTVCSSTDSGFQCRCEEQFAWPYSTCVTYGACERTWSTICKCINAIPPGNQSCQPIPALLTQVEYDVEVELNVTDVATVDYLRSLLKNNSFSFALGPIVNVTNIDINTVCYLNGSNSQCKCEDQYVWSSTDCATNGACDEITNDTCSCINSIPSNGQYCQPKTVVYTYLISVELNISDVGLINPLRTILSNISYPISINHMLISDVNISTVCSPRSSGYQCRCEDQYRWSCDHCFMYGSCDNITSNTCGCINAIPADGQHFCSPSSSGYKCRCEDQYGWSCDQCFIYGSCDITSNTCGCINAIPADGKHCQPLTETVFKIEMSMRLDMVYTSELSDTSSTVYKDLKSKIDKVIVEQFKGIPGYRGGFVTVFSKGSIITKFVVQTTQVDFDQILVENQNFRKAINSGIAPVIGAVSAFYQSSTSISIPELTYTGASLSLKCEPPESFSVGLISSSRWTFNGREIKHGGRFNIITTNSMSMLEVKDVIPGDSGPYSCTLSKNDLEFQQKGFVTESKIKEAPVVRLKSEFHVKCLTGKIQPLKCCVQRPYKIKWFQGKDPLSSVPITDEDTNCIKHDYKLESCRGSGEDQVIFTCRVENPSSYEMKSTMTIFKENFRCNDAQYGTGRVGDRSSNECDKGQVGKRLAECQETGEWKLVVDTCIVIAINQLLTESQTLVVEGVTTFVGNLSKAVQKERQDIENSTATISAIVDILNTVANVSTTVDETIMQNILETVDVIIGEESRESWVILNANETSNSSSTLLGSLESLSSDLDGEFSVRTPRILLNRTTFDDTFMADLNSSIVLNITKNSMSNVFITTILLSTLNIVMPTRNSTFNVSPFNTTSNETASDNAINAAVLLVKINAKVQNVFLSYDKLNSSLTMNPQCVFWNFTLFDNIGAWDDEGCKFVSDINNIVTCSCNHLTSFSILMATDIPPSLREALDIITYVGVGISLASLVICLVIEGYVWKAITRNSTAFMRHVSIVNTALSLLIADICFIIGASIANNPLENPGGDYELPLGPCSTATFFMHFFYLALFFWMLVSGLLLFYRTVMVFSYMSKSIMLAFGFCLGYGCPLIIAVITVAVTAPGNGYIRKSEACWLNWFETKALLAMVIPALTIVFINILIVIVVLYKMLKRGVGDAGQSDEKHTLVVITRCLVILTPLFGLTWGLGVGTMVSSTNKAIHIAFAFFNSLQGFFILLFGVLLDSKTRSLLGRKSPRTSTGSNSTRSTGAGNSSLSGSNFIGRLLGRRYVYHVSQATNPNSSGATESFSNI